MPILSWFEDYGDEIYHGYDMSVLEMDQAYLIPKNVDDIDFYIYKKHKDCIECPYFKIPHEVNKPLILEQVPQHLYKVSSNDLEMLNPYNESNVICNVDYNFGEFGIYNLHVSQSGCDVRILKDPVSIYFPILTIFLIYLGLFTIFWAIKKIYTKFNCCKTETEKENKKARVKSLDTFRGISIVIMIFVNYGAGGYEFMDHAIWNGLHVADLVFPWFMWIMGVCIPISLVSNFRRETPNKTVLYNVFKRGLKLFCIGIFLDSTANLDVLRLCGVLQRFGVCYFIVTTLCLYLMSRNEHADCEGSLKYYVDILKLYKIWFVMFALIAIHTVILFLVPYSNCPKGYLGPGGWHENGIYYNCTGGIAGYLDRTILGEHIYRNPTIKHVYQSQSFDPEGLLGYVPSLLTVFLGVQAGVILITHKQHQDRLIRWLSWAVLCGLLGGLLCGFSREGGFIPVNKNLWSLSFVLVTASFAYTLLSICYFLMDTRKWWSGGPFIFAGMNPIILYVGHALTYNHFPVRWNLHYDAGHRTHFVAAFENLWGMWFWILVAYYLYKIRLFYSV